MGVITDGERETMSALLSYANPQGLHPNEERWRDFSRIELSLRDERIRQLEELNKTLAAEVDRLRREYDEEMTEFNTGYEAAQQGLPESSEPSEVKHDVWLCGYAWAMFGKLKAEVDAQRPVVEAASRWARSDTALPRLELRTAVINYEASKSK